MKNLDTESIKIESLDDLHKLLDIAEKLLELNPVDYISINVLCNSVINELKYIETDKHYIGTFLGIGAGSLTGIVLVSGLWWIPAIIGAIIGRTLIVIKTQSSIEAIRSKAYNIKARLETSQKEV